MKRLVTALFFMVFIVSCSVDFNPEIRKEGECIVVQSCLQPDSTVTIRLFACIAEEEKMKIIPLENASVLLKENDVIIYEGISDSILKLDIYPKTGARYSMTVIHEKYATVTAETCIPEPVKCKAANLGKVGDSGYTTYKLFEFETESAEMAYPLWITSSAIMSNAPPEQHTALFTYNPLIDNVNRYEGLGYVNELVGSGYHKSFFRIKPSNLPRLTDLVFVPKYASVIWKDYIGLEIRLITASLEYDQYCKTYFQLLSAPTDDDIASIMYQPVNVYSNIKGGLGIFAGKSDFVCFFEKEEE
jgi:hypothetical protein